MPEYFAPAEGETPEMFALFQQFLSLGPDRSLPKLAQLTGKTLKTIRQYCARFEWYPRAAAYTVHLAAVEREAAEAATRSLTQATIASWHQRREDLREQEWLAHDECLTAAKDVLKDFKASKRTPSLSEAVKLMELASKLGRLATGLGTEPAESSSGPTHAFRIEIEAALKRVYGEDATVIDVPPGRTNSSQD